MKLFVISLFLIVISISCKESELIPSDVEIYNNEAFNVVQSQKIVFQNSASDMLELKVVEISDIRCPANVQCIRFGNAKVSVNILDGTSIADNIDLCLGVCGESTGGVITEDTVDFSYKSYDYSVILLEVAPYPTTNNSKVAKSAKMKLVAR